MSSRSDELLVYGVRYANTGDALADLDHLEALRKDGHVGRYDAAVVTMGDDGHIAVEDLDATERKSGAWLGGVAGGIVGVIFPPSVLAGAAVGAAAGALAGDVSKRFTGQEAKELGELLEPGQTGLLVVMDWLDEPYRTTLFAKALRERSITIHKDDDIRKAVEAAARQEY